MSRDFSTILLAFDGSEDSVVALKTAEKLTKLCKASLTVVYVDTQKPVGYFPQDPSNAPHLSHSPNATFQQPFPYLGATGVPLSNLIANEPEKEQMDSVDYTPDHILSDARVNLSDVLKDVDYELLQGQPANEICNYAKENDIDLIVIGNRGLSGLKKLVMGSVSDKVTHLAECPVLVVK